MPVLFVDEEELGQADALIFAPPAHSCAPAADRIPMICLKPGRRAAAR
jgi:hypothetical protein